MLCRSSGSSLQADVVRRAAARASGAMPESKRVRMLRRMESKWLRSGRECPAVLRELLDSQDGSLKTLTKREFETVMHKMRCDLRVPDETVEDSYVECEKVGSVGAEREADREGGSEGEIGASAYYLVLPEQDCDGRLATAWVRFWL